MDKENLPEKEELQAALIRSEEDRLEIARALVEVQLEANEAALEAEKTRHDLVERVHELEARAIASEVRVQGAQPSPATASNAPTLNVDNERLKEALNQTRAEFLGRERTPQFGRTDWRTRGRDGRGWGLEGSKRRSRDGSRPICETPGDGDRVARRRRRRSATISAPTPRRTRPRFRRRWRLPRRLRRRRSRRRRRRRTDWCRRRIRNATRRWLRPRRRRRRRFARRKRNATRRLQRRAPPRNARWRTSARR